MALLVWKSEDEFPPESFSPALVKSPALRNARDNSGVDLAAELQKIYDSEINIERSWIWDGGITVRLGDRTNGFVAEANVPTVAEVLPWLQDAVAHSYPDSSYASGHGVVTQL